MDMTTPIKAPLGRPTRSRAGAAALSEAIRRAGGMRAMARGLGNISVQAVANWSIAPAERVLAIEELTGVSRYRLRPDVFGPKPPGRGGRANAV